MIRWCATLALLLALPASAQPAGRASARPQATPEEVEEARALFERGMAAMERSDPSAAQVAFEASFERLPYLATAYNLAVAYEAAGRHRAAADMLERILSGELGALQGVQRREARALLEGVLASVGVVEVRASGAEDAWIRVDAEETTRWAGAAPVRIALEPGHHVVQVGAAGMRPRRLLVHAEAGVENRLRVRFDDRDIGTLRVSANEPDQRVEIVGFATGPSPLVHDVPAGVYEVGVAGAPESRRSVRVEPGAERSVSLLSGVDEGIDGTLIAVVAVAAAVLVAGAAVALGVGLSEDDAVLEEPVFGIIAALRF